MKIISNSEYEIKIATDRSLYNIEKLHLKYLEKINTAKLESDNRLFQGFLTSTLLSLMKKGILYGVKKNAKNIEVITEDKTLNTNMSIVLNNYSESSIYISNISVTTSNIPPQYYIDEYFIEPSASSNMLFPLSWTKYRTYTTHGTPQITLTIKKDGCSPFNIKLKFNIFESGGKSDHELSQWHCLTAIQNVICINSESDKNLEAKFEEQSDYYSPNTVSVKRLNDNITSHFSITYNSDYSGKVFINYYEE